MFSLAETVEKIKDSLRVNKLSSRRLFVIAFLTVVAALSLFVIQQNLNISKRASEGGFGRDIWGLAYRIECSRRAQEKFANFINTADSTKKREINAFFNDCILSLTSDPTPTPTGSLTVTPTPTGSTNPTPTVTLTPTPTESTSPTGTPTLTPTQSPSGSSVELLEAYVLGKGSKLPSVAVDSTGKRHYAWWDPTDPAVWYSVCQETKSSCSSAVRISQSGKKSYYSSVTIDSANKPYIVWETKRSDGGYDVYFSKLENNSWTSPKLISNGNYSEVPVITIDAGDKIHVVFQSKNSSTSNVYYTSSSDGGVNWLSPFEVGAGMYPRIKVEQNGKIHVVWNGNSPAYGIFYRSSSGSQWSNQVNVTTGGKEQISDLAVGQNGTVHVVWGDYSASKVFYRTIINNQPQSSKENITGGVTSLWPKIALDNQGNVYVAYQAHFEAGSWDIYLVVKKSSNWQEPVIIQEGNNVVQTPGISLNGNNGAISYFDPTNVWTRPFKLK